MPRVGATTLSMLASVLLLCLLGQGSSFITPLSVRSSVGRRYKTASPLRMGMEHLQVGSVAPPFSVKDQDGMDVTLESLKGKYVVVYFYPKDNTSGCTKEACKFRDLKSEYDACDCVVLGVSADSEDSHSQFIAEHGLNFNLLADTNKALIKAYGATKEGQEDAIQRSTVLVDKEGKVAAVWNPVTAHEAHPVEVLETIGALPAMP